MNTRRQLLMGGVLVCALLIGRNINAQVGSGLDDMNALPEAALAALPGMNPSIAKGFVAARPFPTIVAANAFLLGQKLTQEQINSIYEKAFIHLNLNTATAEEILLVPRIARRMTREFEEYRPWKTFAQFDREIGKYVAAEETARLKKYVFIPLNLNTATEADFKTIPNLAARMPHEFEEYRPWKTKAQFDREIGKYLGDKETARLWRFMVIP
jgi:DNA uptake protein ComE-like DNA-binding protein